MCRGDVLEVDTSGSVLALGHHPQIKKRGDVGLELHAPYFTKVKSPSREEVDIYPSLLPSFLKAKFDIAPEVGGNPW